jgi:hypothetical protein
MTQIEMQSAAASAAVRPVSSRRYVIRFVVSSISSLAGLISFVLIGPTTHRIAAVDPALEAFYSALLAGWFGSLGRMWFLTFRERNRQ